MTKFGPSPFSLSLSLLMGALLNEIKVLRVIFHLNFAARLGGFSTTYTYLTVRMYLKSHWKVPSGDRSPTRASDNIVVEGLCAPEFERLLFALSPL